jgi:hypothetical protein
VSEEQYGTRDKRIEEGGKMRKRKTERIGKKTGGARVHAHHLRVPFIRDLYWTSPSSLVLNIPFQFYFALRRAGLLRKHVSQVNILGFKMELLYPYAEIIGDELPMWEKTYLPVSVKGKIVLDVGAGCGETSAFYIAHGASKVVAIEPDKRAYSLLLKNVRENSFNVVPIRKPFELSDLLIPHDLLKIDADGAEVALLNYQGSLGECVVEAHTVGINRMHLGPIIARKFDLKVVCKLGKGEDIWLLSSA